MIDYLKTELPTLWEVIKNDRFLRVFFAVVIGFPLVFFLSRLTGRIKSKSLSPQNRLLLQKGVLYGGIAILIVMILQQLEYKLTALLGAAGIVGIAVGFAAQAGLSNVISGFFLIVEKPFVVGDIISMGQTFGTVVEIDLLSVRVRTFDNMLVRIPNENIVKTEISNVTRYPVRRMDLKIGVAYKEDIDYVTEVLRDIAHKNHYVMDEPEPLVVFKNFGDSALELQFSVWFVMDNYWDVRHTVMCDVKNRFDAEGIEIPFPHRTIYTGEVTKPYPVRVSNADEEHSGESLEPDQESSLEE